MNTITENSALDTISKIVYGRESISTRWGNRHIRGQGRGLRLDPSAEARLACAFGFILGLAVAHAQ